MARGPGVGDVAPEFTLVSTAGPIQLRSELESGPVLLVFYPGDDTPVCTRQLCNYRDNLKLFDELGVQVLAINPQSPESHGRFAEKHSFPFPLLSDLDGSVCKQYDALGLFGKAKRSLVVVGQDGIVRWRRSDFALFHQSAEDIRSAVASLTL